MTEKESRAARALANIAVALRNHGKVAEARQNDVRHSSVAAVLSVGASASVDFSVTTTKPPRSGAGHSFRTVRRGLPRSLSDGHATARMGEAIRKQIVPRLSPV